MSLRKYGQRIYFQEMMTRLLAREDITNSLENLKVIERSNMLEVNRISLVGNCYSRKIKIE
jgi:hypothetical protein